MQIDKDVLAILNETKINEGLPSELDSAIRKLLSKNHQDSIKSALYARAKLDLNQLNILGQVTSKRNMIPNTWTLVIHYSTGTGNDREAWRLYNPNGEIEFQAGEADGKSFKALIDNGIAFAIDPNTASSGYTRTRDKWWDENGPQILDNVEHLLSNIGYEKDPTILPSGAYSQEKSLVMKKGRYAIEINDSVVDSHIDLGLKDLKHNVYLMGTGLDLRQFDDNDNYLGLMDYETANAEILKIVKKFINEK